MATLSPSLYVNQGPPTDIELALFRIQEKERQRHLHALHQQQQEEMQRRVENLESSSTLLPDHCTIG